MIKILSILLASSLFCLAGCAASAEPTENPEVAAPSEAGPPCTGLAYDQTTGGCEEAGVKPEPAPVNPCPGSYPTDLYACTSNPSGPGSLLVLTVGGVTAWSCVCPAGCTASPAPDGGTGSVFGCP